MNWMKVNNVIMDDKINRRFDKLEEKLVEIKTTIIVNHITRKRGVS